MISGRLNMPWHEIDVKRFAQINDFSKTEKALVCAEEYFRFVKRKDGRDEFIHPYRVAQILIFHGVCVDVALAGGLLHDIPENINYNLIEDIFVGFGEEVGMIVWLLTRREGEDERFYFARIGEDIITILVKMADRLHNLRNMTKNLGSSSFFTKDRLAKQVDETWEFIVPMIVRAIKIGCEYRKVIIEIHEELLRSLADAEWSIINSK